MYCSSCGTKNGAENNFCRQCGRKLDRESAPKITEEAFDRALPEQEQVTALLERAYRLRKAGDLPGAIALCNEVLQIRPDSTTGHGLLGQLYEQNGERDKAVEQYERVLQLNPGSIADRVKLDDLRDGGPKPPNVRNSSMPKIVIVDPDGAPIRGAVAWGAALAAVLILSGAALAIVLNRRDPDKTMENQSAVRPLKQNQVSDRAAAGDRAQGATPSGPIQSGVAATAPAVSGFGSSSNAPSYGFPVPPIQYSAPPIYVLPQGGVARTQNAAPGSASGTARRPGKSGTPAERGPVETESPDSQRVHLTDVSDGSNGGDAHNPIIVVRRHDDVKTGSRAVANQGPDASGTIIVTPHKGQVDSSASFAPSAEASANISIGQEKLNKMDYAGAILAFRKALGGANDEVGYVCQKMAETYQAMNENKNAVSMYERARDEYKKLIAAGRQVDQAGQGILVCQTGITICSKE